LLVGIGWILLGYALWSRSGPPYRAAHAAAPATEGEG